MADDQNQRMMNYWGANLRNAGRSLNPFDTEKKMEPVPDWKAPDEQGQPAPATNRSRELLSAPVSPPAAPSTAMPSQTPNASINRSSAGQDTASPSPSTSSQPFKVQMRGGVTYTSDDQGNRTYTMGTPGGPGGYARAQVAAQQPGTTSRTRELLAGNIPAPYTFQGSAEDAAKFAAPSRTRMLLSGQLPASSLNQAATASQQPARSRSHELLAGNMPSPIDISHQAWLEHSGKAQPSGGMEPPKYLGPESGLGWKTRLKMYGDQMDAYNKATGNKTAMDIEAMREAGAGGRALLAAQGVNDENAIARQRLGGDLALNQARIGTEQLNQQKGQMELGTMQSIQSARNAYMQNPTAENEARYRGAIGKFEKEPQFGTVGKYDDQGTKIGEQLYNRQTGDIKMQGGQAYPEATREASTRKVGQVYSTPKGPMRWTGKGWDDSL